MSKKIEQLRDLSGKVDFFYTSGRREEGKALLLVAQEKAKSIDRAYYYFFQSEWAGYEESDPEKQQMLLSKALDLRPDDYYLLKNRGTLSSKIGNQEEALSWYDNALKFNPKDYSTMRDRAVSLSKLGHEKEAIAWFNKALAINPNDFWAWYFISDSFLNLNSPDKAYEAADRSAQLAPDNKLFIRWRDFIASKTGKKPVELRRKTYSKKLTSQFKKDKLLSNEKIPYAYIKGPEIRELFDAVDQIRKQLGKKVIKKFLDEIETMEKTLTDFLSTSSHIKTKRSLFFILRKWNSFTPIIPAENTNHIYSGEKDERHVGGGYVLLNDGEATIIDPGYNFIENFHAAGFRVRDIRNIVLTHAHNDHTIDFESLLSLIYQYNKKKKLKAGDVGFKDVNLFMNTGSFMKFSGMLDLRGADYIATVNTLMPYHTYKLGHGIDIEALPAYHDEVVTKTYAVGLRIKIKRDESDYRTIIITSDSGLFPKLKNPSEEMGELNLDQPEIWKTYKQGCESVNLLIAHLGSIKKQEFEVDWRSKPAKVFYEDHLGMIGVSWVITKLKPKLAVVSEMGEELTNIQKNLIKMIAKVVKKLLGRNISGKINILPGDLPFIYDIWNEEICCAFSKEFVAAKDIRYGLCEKRFYYFHKKYCDDMDELGDKAKQFELARNNKEKLYFVEE